MDCSIFSGNFFRNIYIFFILDGLVEVNPFKTTTVTSSTFCSFDCADNVLCLSFVYLKQRTTENCLLSRDANGGSSSEDSETYIIQNESFEASFVQHGKVKKIP